MTPTPEPRDRRGTLVADDAIVNGIEVNGIDYVEIASADQRTLRVHFLNEVVVAGTITDVTIFGGETIPTVAVTLTDDTALDSEGRPVVTLQVPAPGDFSTYTLKIVSPALDPYFSQAAFSFKARCPSDLDCAEPCEPCPPPVGELPPIDYLAKDFLSFRRALEDFSALRYPDWRERAEADFGMMFLEALSALADDLSYTQDRIAAEANLDTATQRRSLVRLARLVDYEPRPALSARVDLQLDVVGTTVPGGLLISAFDADGNEIAFETGAGLIDPRSGGLNLTTHKTNPAWNRGLIKPYYFDDADRCLRAGATSLWVEGDLRAIEGQRLLIDSEGATPADPPIRAIVTVIDTNPGEDPVFLTSGSPTMVTQLMWGEDEALVADHDLTKTTLAGNIVPATQGRRRQEIFSIPPEFPPPGAIPPTTVPQAIVRDGPARVGERLPCAAEHVCAVAETAPQFLYTLGAAPLAWLLEDAGDALPQPEIYLERVFPGGASKPWRWWRSLLQAPRFERAFTIDPAAYRLIAHTARGEAVFDYDGDAGDTIRFGDGVFGDLPEWEARYRVLYRSGAGAAGNIAPDSITRVDPSAAFMITAASNPFPATGGADPEAAERVRRIAPQAFRARQFRAVRAEDYQRTAEELPWVQRAGSSFRWTGSWLTVFTSADPKGSLELPREPHLELIELLNRRRLAGYESYVPVAQYVSLDLTVTVCARPDAFRGDVEEAVIRALGSGRFADGRLGFFHPDSFSFGQPLERSRLEAAIQAAHGVAGVLDLQYRLRRRTGVLLPLPDMVIVAPDEILRLDNNPSRPERGALRVIVEGGK